MFLTNGKVAATVNVTIKEKDDLRMRRGKMEQSQETYRRREDDNLCKMKRKVVLIPAARGPRGGGLRRLPLLSKVLTASSREPQEGPNRWRGPLGRKPEVNETKVTEEM